MVESLTRNLPIAAACLMAILAAAGRLPEAYAADAQDVKVRDIPPKAYALFSLGTRQYNAQDWKAAADTFRKVIELDPDAVDARVKLAASMARLSQQKKAISILKEAIELDPTSVEARTALGPLLVRDLQVEEGLRQYKTAIEYADDAQKTKLLSSLSRAYKAAGEIDKAIEHAQRMVELSPSSTKGLLLLTQLHNSNGDFKAAATALSKVVDLHPESNRFRLLLAELYVKAGDFDDATDTYDACLDSVPLASNKLRICFTAIARLKRAGADDHTALYRDTAVELISEAVETLLTARGSGSLAALLSGDKEVIVAMQVLKSALAEAEPEKRAELHYTTAGLLMYAGRTVDAVEQVKKAIELRDTEAKYHVLLGIMLARTENFEPACESLRKAVKLSKGDYAESCRMHFVSVLEAAGKRSEAIDQLRKTVLSFPNSIQPRLRLAQYCRRDGRYDAAARHIEAAALLPSDDIETAARVRFMLADAYGRLQRYDDAAQQIRLAIRMTPENHLGYLRLAFVLQDQGKYNEAIAVLDDAAETFPEEDPSLFVSTKARSLELLGQTRKAEALLRKTVKKHPGSPDVHGALSIFLTRQGSYEEAVTSAKKAIELADDIEVVDYRLQLAGIYQDMGKYDECEKLLLSEHKRLPGSSAVNNHLGYFYAEQDKKLDEAVRLIRKALDARPTSGAYLDSLGWALYKQGNYEEALPYLKRAVVEQRDAVILDHLGDLLHAMHKTGSAKAKWREALECHPAADLEKAIRTKLETPPPTPDRKEPPGPPQE